MMGRGAGRRQSRGQALVEFALVIPIFFTAIVGIAEGGYYVMASTLVNHAAQEGARLAILESTANTVAVRNRVSHEAAPGTTLAASDITIRVNGSIVDDASFADRETGDRLSVEVAYDHAPLVGYIFPGLTFPASAASELWVE